MIIVVGSTNPVKVNAVTIAASEQWPDLHVEGIEVPSGVSDQPMTDQETKQGAINRAKTALQIAVKKHPNTNNNDLLGIGLEGGIFMDGKEMWSTVWGVAVDQEENLFATNGARIKISPSIANRILSGEEMGHAMAHEAGEKDLNKLKTTNGLIGIVTNNFVDRTEEYSMIAKLAIGLWFGRDWQEKLKRNK